MTSKTLNLREGPGSEYDIITTLPLHKELIYLAMIGDWVKVKSRNEETTGFVHYKYVVVVDK
ncbi:SH3 domain-containing protein [Christiangramia sp. LLG6405-1]|uniref:SH3 domain-containing protein n=1 Tax=Christiangramia sp. LLG6405-1 TaxID=3160832 RepID=UPI00386D07BF